MNNTLLLLILLLLVFGGGGGYYGYGQYGATGLGGVFLLVLIIAGVFWYMGFPRRKGDGS